MLPSVNIPLQKHDDGSIRIGNTRVLLELVIRAFQRGQTPESIVSSYPTLDLADTYAVIAYYLQNPAEIDAYMEQVTADAEEIRAKIEAQQPDIQAIREQLSNS